MNRHARAPSRADSVSSDASSSSTLVDSTEAPVDICFDDEHVMMQLDYMLPISEYPECSIPPSPSSVFLPDELSLANPSSSAVNLLQSHPSPTSTRPRLWLHRHKRAPAPRASPPPSPSDSRTQSFLTALLQARWPKSEPEEPIFGQTAPRAVSPFRGKPRPHSAASVPRSILRADAAHAPAIKPARSLGCVKFAERAGVWEYSSAEEDDSDPFADPLPHPRVAWRMLSAQQQQENDGDGDSIITLPPPGERAPGETAKFFRRLMPAVAAGGGKGTRPAKERPVISAPMPLARASSLREMKEANRSHTELMKEISTGPPKKGNKLRSFVGRCFKGS
ncbi:hypothetical protein BC834DRAFT_967083 [Gloeopeniophorella convolvens]|nr:hypothetical protein BC834DRAFT_967083 [Gloeopeniophorella convolvens]